MRSRRLIGVIAGVMVLGLLLAATASVFVTRWQSWRSVEISGVVLRNDDDPKKQVPVANAAISASDGQLSTSAQSDANGFFAVKIASSWRPRSPDVWFFAILNMSLSR